MNDDDYGRYIRVKWPTFAEQLLGFELGSQHALQSVSEPLSARFYCSCGGWEMKLRMADIRNIRDSSVSDAYHEHLFDLLAQLHPTLEEMTSWGWFNPGVDP